VGAWVPLITTSQFNKCERGTHGMSEGDTRDATMRNVAPKKWHPRTMRPYDPPSPQFSTRRSKEPLAAYFARMARNLVPSGATSNG